MKKNVLSSALLIILLSSCASGGGEKNGNGGSGVTVVPDFQPPAGHFEWTQNYKMINLSPAQAEGLTGKGVVLGFIDTKVDPTFPTLIGHNLLPEEISDGRPPSVNEGSYNHGTAVATVALGSPYGYYQGGIAPKAKFVSTQRLAPYNLLEMVKVGASILNFSVQTEERLGQVSDGYYRDYLNGTKLIDAYREINNSGKALFVHASGNASHSSPSAGASAPYYFPEITNWVVVAATNYEGTELASYSNRCGLAKDFCMVAPGIWRQPSPLLTQGAPFSSYRWVGTSFAAPTVSGAAALIKEKYNWMTGTQLAQTLLTTATDMGAPGVDEIYGHGMLNIGKAIQGPASFTSAFTAAVPSGVVSVFGNNIDGTGSLVKSGEGELVLNGASSYQGGTFLNEGSLQFNNTVIGDIHQSSGNLKLGASVNGSLTQSAGTLWVRPNESISVSGEAQLTGNIQVGSWSNSQSEYAGGQWTTSITSPSLSLSGAPDVSSSLLFYNAQVNTVDNTLNIVGSRQSGVSVASASSFGDQSTQQAIHALDENFKALDQNSSNLQSRQALANWQFMDASEVAAVSLDSLAGQAHASARGLSIENADIHHQWTFNRSDDAYRSDNGGFWAMAGHYDGKIRPASSFNLDVNSTSFGFGADRPFADGKAYLGAFVSKDDIRSNFNRFGGNVKSRQTSFGVFGGTKISDDVHLRGSLSYADITNDVERTVVVPTLAPSSVGSKTDAKLLSANIGVEKQFDKIAVGLDVQHDQLTSSSFREQGNSGFELLAQKSQASRTQAGTYIRFLNGEVMDASKWSFDAILGYYRVLNAPSTGFWASYSANPAVAFYVDGMEVPKDVFWGKFGATRTFGDGKNSLGLDLDVKGTKLGVSSGVSLVYRREF